MADVNPKDALIEFLAKAIYDHQTTAYDDRMGAPRALANAFVAVMSDMIWLGRPKLDDAGTSLTRDGAIAMARKWGVVTAIMEASRRDTIHCPVDHDALGHHMHEQGYREGLAVGLAHGRARCESILDNMLGIAQREAQGVHAGGGFHIDSLPAELQHTKHKRGDGISLGDPAINHHGV